jgi:hypothetical protein
MTPDVNILVAAFREEHPHHFVARSWLTEALEQCRHGGTLELLPMVAAGFVRVATSSKAFSARVTSRAALAFIRSILAVPGVTMPSLGSEWAAFEKLCVDLELSGADISDGWIAATVKANGLRLVTFDADFDRLLEPSECLRLQSPPGVQERRGSYVLRRRSPRRAVAAG